MKLSQKVKSKFLGRLHPIILTFLRDVALQRLLYPKGIFLTFLVNLVNLVNLDVDFRRCGATVSTIYTF